MNKVINFPEFIGMNCKMMPFIQGDPESLPKEYRSYSDIVENNYLDKGRLGYLTLHESIVSPGTSQRGYNSGGLSRSVHVEVGQYNSKYRWGGGSWGGKNNVWVDEDTEVLIANNLDNTCRYWNTVDKRFTVDGDLSEYINDYPEESGILMKSGEIVKIGVFTPHESMVINEEVKRQFIRIVGDGVIGKESYFTFNPIIKL